MQFFIKLCGIITYVSFNLENGNKIMCLASYKWVPITYSIMISVN